MSIYGYIRLNSHRPTPKNLGLREQARVIRTWSEEHGLEVRKIFRDTESSSASLELPNLKKGGLSVISQSGSLIGALLAHGQSVSINSCLIYLQNTNYALFLSQKVWIQKLKVVKKFWQRSLSWHFGTQN